jgi:hypothetical protein
LVIEMPCFVGVGGSVGYLSSLPGVTLVAALAQVTWMAVVMQLACIPTAQVPWSYTNAASVCRINASYQQLLGCSALLLAMCVPQGNALGRGPLVLHLPMRMLATIRQRAAAALPAAAAATAAAQQSYGVDSFSSTHTAIASNAISTAVGSTETCSMNAAAFAQLLLDMHRQAGVMLLDRMGDSVVQHMAAHVEVAVQVGAVTWVVLHVCCRFE